MPLVRFGEWINYLESLNNFLHQIINRQQAFQPQLIQVIDSFGNGLIDSWGA